MASFKVYRTSAFTEAMKGGNEAGVSLDAGHMDERTMQMVAQKVGYSETAFIRKIEGTHIHVRYFTPTSEVPLCGHATIAFLNLLRHLGRVSLGTYTIHTVAGAFPVAITSDKATLIFPEPRVMGTYKSATIAQMLALDAGELHPGLPVASVDAGVRELYIGLSEGRHLKHLDVDRDALLRLSDHADVSGVVFYATDTDGSLAEVRNFLPRIGIEEESATGTAAAALSKLLYTYKSPFEDGFIHQGESLGKPSRIDVAIHADASAIGTIEISGKFRVIDMLDVTL